MPIARTADRKKGSERADLERGVVVTVSQALRHARIDAPVDTIRVQREPFAANGARAEAFAQGTRFAKERLWHVRSASPNPSQAH